MTYIEKSFTFRGVKDKKIHVRHCIPEKTEKVFIVFHGICEHSGRYDNFINYFIKRNTEIYLPDHRGHGKSDGRKGTIEDFDDFAQDCIQLLDIVSKRPKINCYVIAHSMGALITTYAYLNYPMHFKNIKGIVLSSPAYRGKDFPEILQEPVIKMTELFKKHFKDFFLTPLIAPRNLINDPKEVLKYKKDPLIVKKLHPSIFNQLIKAMIYCDEHIEEIEIPILILIAGKDYIVDTSTILNHHQRMKSKKKQKIIYNNSYHELFNDLYRHKVFSDIELWLTTQKK